jgi:hypothetical protein
MLLPQSAYGWNQEVTDSWRVVRRTGDDVKMVDSYTGSQCKDSPSSFFGHGEQGTGNKSLGEPVDCFWVDIMMRRCTGVSCTPR